jgi:peptide/nickel transport system substrate-binding protein
MTEKTTDARDDHENANENRDRTHLDRRAFVKATGLGATGLTTALAGCTGGESEDDGNGDDDSTATETEYAQETPESDETTAESGEIRRGGTLVWGHSEVTQNLDIHQTATASTGRFLNSVYESLIGLDRSLELTSDPEAQSAGLATDWSVSDDQLTYEFTLREGVTFHDGSELTADDVVYSFERIANPETNAILRGAFRTMDTVSADGDYAVTVEHTDVFQPFLRQLAFSGTAIVPADSGEQLGEQPVGTGPFAFESRQQGNKAKLVAHEDYWGTGPYLDGVEERTVTDPDSRLTGVQEDEYDLINDIPLDDINDVVGTDSDDLSTLTWRPLSWAFLNMNNAEAPFDDPDFRKAVDFAIDKQELVEGALFGNGAPTASPSFPNSPFRNEDLEVRARDVDRATQLIEESAYDAEEFDLTFKVTTNYPWHIDAATIMQQRLREVGLNVELQQQQWGDWLSEVFVNGNFRLAMVNFFTFWEPAYLYRSVWASDGSFNFRNYESEAFDSAIDTAQRAASREDAIANFKKAQAVLHEETPDVMLWFRDGTVAANQSVNGTNALVSPNNSELNFGQVWLDD